MYNLMNKTQRRYIRIKFFYIIFSIEKKACKYSIILLIREYSIFQNRLGYYIVKILRNLKLNRDYSVIFYRIESKVVQEGS